ncbi:hypothetical protein HSRCO_1149 [Halanaeroarchaeum sp. HSR-CO]|uniref:hypothetical protein n=1 Tax=Halanaeroarchaeum sp. HSR-CO TaxID=2866382 RepID=UPI00217F008E|nr:hypothetical protein [Halanaeroarchaeum sp. HSR-CO]UWG47436.1 hypothetical protein HSRCO_1149 [Halanaeroarchaeum sp. HSR-CO]
MIDIIVEVLVVSISVLLMGWLTVKITLWGGLASIIVYLMYAIIPEFSAQDVSEAMWPAFIDLWLLVPDLFMSMVSGAAADGLLGQAISGGLVIAISIPYLVGLCIAFVTYPELIFVRMLF